MDISHEPSFTVTREQMAATIARANAAAVLAREPDKSYEPYDVGQQDCQFWKYPTFFGQFSYFQQLGERKTHPMQQDVASCFHIPVTRPDLWQPEQLGELFNRALYKVELALRCYMAGSTFCGVLRLGDWLITANMGDSRAVFIQKNGEEKWQTKALSCLHNLDNPDERARVIADGGNIIQTRLADGRLSEERLQSNAALGGIYSVTTMRAFGNNAFHNGLGRMPELSCINIRDEINDLQSVAGVLLYSDGFLCPVRQLGALLDQINTENMSTIPEQLCGYSLSHRHSRDNCTVSVLPVWRRLQRSWPARLEISFVADGHGLLGHVVAKQIKEILQSEMLNSVQQYETDPTCWPVPIQTDEESSVTAPFPTTQPDPPSPSVVNEENPVVLVPADNGDEMLLSHMSPMPFTAALQQARSQSWTCGEEADREIRANAKRELPHFSSSCLS